MDARAPEMPLSKQFSRVVALAIWFLVSALCVSAQTTPAQTTPAQAPANAANSYIGSEQCGLCHVDLYKVLQKSAL